MILVYLLSGYIFACMLMGYYNSWKEKLQCKEAVVGTITKKEEYKDFNGWVCFKIFVKYTYKGKEYENEILDKVTERKMKKLEESKVHKLFVNEYNPNRVRIDENIFKLGQVFMAVFCVIMLLGIVILSRQWLNKYIFC